MTIETYPEMNAKIAVMLRYNDDPMLHYTAQRIEELETEVEWLQRELHDEQVRHSEWEKMYNQAMVNPTPDTRPCTHSRNEHLERLFCAAQNWRLMLNTFNQMRNSFHSGVRYQSLGRPASDARKAETTFWKILAELELEPEE